MGPEALAQVLRPLATFSHPDLIVGLQTSDDAAVFRLRPDLAIIQTLDFFSPIVDDPYSFGRIACANSLSDVYAMGGDVLLGLNIAEFPDDLPATILSEILRGGADAMREAGGIIAGGHTVIAAEPRYGLSVTGTIHPDAILTKDGAKPGDQLFLTKPLGTGILTTALKHGRLSDAGLAAAVRAMEMLNRSASIVARAVGATACTDVTGFGLLGHAQEVASKSNVRLTIDAASVPLLPLALDLAAEGEQPGGLGRNSAYYLANGVRPASNIDPTTLAVLFDPQTSGGLLFSVPAERARDVVGAANAQAIDVWRIGEVHEGSGVDVIVERG